MNFLRALPCLLLALALRGQAPMLEEIVRGGGEVILDGTAFRLEPASVNTLPARTGLPALVRVTGRLVPPDPAGAFGLELTILKDGTLYMLRILRKGPGGYPDTWAATGRTRARITLLEDHSGGRLEIACSGPLTGVIGRRPKTTTWRGSLWVILP